MSKIISIIPSICIALILGIASVSHAQIAKQGNFEITGIYQGQVSESVKVDDYTLSVIGFTLVNFNASGGGFMHNTSSICRLIAIPGDFHTYCITSDMDGDRIYSHATVEGGTIGVSGGGRKATFVGGTGKYEGIQGGYEYEAIYAPNIEGYLVGHIKGSGKYTIP